MAGTRQKSEIRKAPSFEDAELGIKIGKAEFKDQEPRLRTKLLEAQFALANADFPVVIIVSGVDGAGKGEVVHRLNEWLDPRHVETHAFWDVSEGERERPYYWQFWQALPGKGRIGMFFGSWYTCPIIDRVSRKLGKDPFARELARISFFENMLVNDGALLLKFWYHLSRKAQYDRLRKLEKNARTRARVTPTDWKHHKLYDRFARISERALQETDSDQAPWRLIEGTDRRYRELTTGRILLDGITKRLNRSAPPKPRKPRPPAPPARSVLDEVDLKPTLSEESYRRQLARRQGQLGSLAWKFREKGVSTVAAFEGWDGAGKGGAIRRVTQAMDPRLVRVISVAAPTDEECAQHYLWRFWRQVSTAGKMTIFDRSWYGRVLVERVEGFARPAEWRRAYREINEFEEQLVDHGIVLLKFWIHISKEEQLKRFEARKEVDYKRHKITEEDWRNRKQWDAYLSAINDMVTRTSTDYAPWTLVAGNDKRTARVQILKTFVNALTPALE